MRTKRQTRPSRMSRSGKIPASGSGLPARTTVPTFREARLYTGITATDAFAWDSTALNNDRSVGMISVTNVGGSAPTDITLTSIEGYDATISGTGHGTTFSHSYVAKALRKTTTADAEANVTLACLPSSGIGNITPIALGCIFVGSSVNGNPTLNRLVAGDDVLPADFSTGANVLNWPTVEVPAGYTAVYMLNIGGDASGFTWAVATERADGGSFAGTDTANTIATLNGPHTGAGVTTTLTGLGARVASRGIFAAIYLVPGT